MGKSSFEDSTQIDEMQAILACYGTSADLTDNWKTIRCPFHDDVHASGRAITTAFFCNVCGKKGSCISLLMEVERCDVSRAFEILEGITGGSYKRVPITTKRKSWGVDPWREGTESTNDKSLPARHGGFPDLWG